MGKRFGAYQFGTPAPRRAQDPMPHRSPEQRSLDHARHVIAALDDDQVQTYFGTDREGAVPIMQAERAQAQEHRRLVPQPDAALVEERTSAEAALDGAGAATVGLRRVVNIAFHVTGWVFIGGGLLAFLMSQLNPFRWQDDDGDLVLDTIIGVPFVASAVAMPIAGALLVWRGMLDARLVREHRRRLLVWAIHRPGQLGRGLPFLGNATGGSRWAIWSPVVVVLAWTLMTVGGFFALMGPIPMLIGLLTADWDFLTAMTVMCALGVGTYLAGRQLLRQRNRLDLRKQDTAQALVWLWEGLSDASPDERPSGPATAG